MASIDSNYYTVSGPQGSFDSFFDPRVCDLDQLFATFQQGIVDQNQFGAQNGGPDANSIANMIKSAVTNAAQVTGVPDSLILAVIMRESSGNARIDTPFDGDGNPTGGLMQCEGEPGFPPFDDSGNPIQVTLTQDDINRMVMNGANHLRQNLADFNEDFWSAVREYNSGSVADPDNLSNQGQFGVSSYVDDIGNILHGYVMGSQPGH